MTPIMFVMLVAFFAAVIAVAWIMRPRPLTLDDNGLEGPALVEENSDADRLLNEVRKLLGEFVLVRSLAQSLSKRVEWLQPAAVIGVIVGLLGLGVGISGLVAASSATHDADQASISAATANASAAKISEERANSAVNLCTDFNRFATNHNHLVDNMENVIRNAATPRPDWTPAQQAAAEKFVSDNIATLETSRVPPRDCSSAVAQAFYNNQQPVDSTTTTTTTTTVPPPSS